MTSRGAGGADAGPARTDDGVRRRLRAVPALAGDLPGFDPAGLPAGPTPLFLAWLDEALAAGVPEPHATTVATADADGVPHARVVVLKDVHADRWSFATDRRSGKAADLAVNPAVSLSWYWPLQGRQVRLVGTARFAEAPECAEDFLARSPASRAAALAVRPGEVLGSVGELHEAIAAARGRVEAEPHLVLPDWVVVHVEAAHVEFWQGRGDRAHVRVQYGRAADGAWRHGLVWP